MGVAEAATDGKDKEIGRLPYEAPSLIEHGTIDDIVRAVTGAPGDGNAITPGSI